MSDSLPEGWREIGPRTFARSDGRAFVWWSLRGWALGSTLEATNPVTGFTDEVDAMRVADRHAPQAP